MCSWFRLSCLTVLTVALLSFSLRLARRELEVEVVAEVDALQEVAEEVAQLVEMVDLVVAGLLPMTAQEVLEIVMVHQVECLHQMVSV